MAELPPAYDMDVEDEGLNSSPSFLYLESIGLTGKAGALQILTKIQPQCKFLFLWNNNLGSIGVEYLFEGLERIRASHARDHNPFGLNTVRIGKNNLRDEGVFEVLGYAVNDTSLETLNIDENGAELADAVGFVELLNATTISSMRLDRNPLRTKSVITLFEGILSKVTSLGLVGCRIQPQCVPSIVAYFESPRSWRLRSLTIMNNSMGREGIAAILAAIERTNFSLEEIWPPFYGSGEVSPEEEARVERERVDNHKADKAADRSIKRIRVRNQGLAARVRMAAARVIAPARIVLHAIAARSDEMSDSPSTGEAGTFRLLDLPRELQLDIVRHCSRDGTAFSQAQWLRILAHAEDRGSITRMASKLREMTIQCERDLENNNGMDSDDSNRFYNEPLMETLYFWREQVGCVMWERDLP
ncbi:uncharacterized protein LOC62_04G006204 [Vanrija pseudolonga]|uniref:RNI-like protein n=1 Tax=Vanrija pseudolonga TaxID=143232 RepID=A0AAF1BIV6_9TREE|nr:hypothetical protein LOC62_04G006204 [Vanrija pseudolonga]